jgi:hypothetical protein
MPVEQIVQECCLAATGSALVTLILCWLMDLKRASDRRKA